MDSNELIRVTKLKKDYPMKKGLFSVDKRVVRALDDINLRLYKGETLGIVGESGSGKTTLSRCLIKAIEPTSGKIVINYDNKEIDVAPITKYKELEPLRKMMNMIIQDPYLSLNPRFTIMDIISEPMVYKGASRQQCIDRVKEIMPLVGLKVEYLFRFAHAFSGGQRQRIGIARALSSKPDVIICDEAVSALDVSVQAQILNLLMDIQEQLHISYIFISHDLSVVEHISDRVAVMYAGQLVELAEKNTLFFNPKHPYTEALLSASPRSDASSRGKRIILNGEVVSPVDLPSGCYFHPRCIYAKDICKSEKPVFKDVSNGHACACHFVDELHLRGV